MRKAIAGLVLLVAVGCGEMPPTTKPVAVHPAPKENPAIAEARKTAPVRPARPDMSIRSEDLANDYGQDNDLTAAAKYEGKFIQVYGGAVKASKDAKGPYVAFSTLASGDPNIFCYMRPGQDGALAALNLSRQVTIQGICKGKKPARIWTGWKLEFEDCLLVEQE